MATTVNPYLQGNFGPVSEERTETELPVSGTLPAALDGWLLRDGPNPAGEVPPTQHWFVGDGMVHGIELRGGRAVQYRNRWIRTTAVEEAIGLPAGTRSPNDIGLGSGNVNVIGHGGRILGLSEVGLPWEVDAGLETVGQYDFGGRLEQSMTAHPKIDPVTGELLFFGYTPFGPPFLRYHRADATGDLVQTVEIEIPQSTMMHDWGVTASRVVFMDFPVVFDMALLESPGAMPYRWDDDTAARLGVMPRDGGDVTWIDVEPGYVFHPLNAHDHPDDGDGGRIVMDVVWYPRMFDVDPLGPREEVLGSLRRWTIDPTVGTVATETLDDRPIEFPRVADEVATRPHRFGYATTLTGSGFATGDLLRYDFEAGTTEVHPMGPGRHASEGVFVADPEGEGEGDGWVLAVVYDEADDRSEVIVVDARDFTADPVARVQLPVRVPFGFHGNWVPREDAA